ncbi:AMP-binding protein [Nocardioides sp. YIM 152588]|uniref:AMP-binding protein n=1 Tax=Nocardioides sp. YIM 152588 TaxID=3158259 RepID=UPI0032E41B16
MQNSPARPWTVHYPAGVTDRVDVPDEPVTAGFQRAAARWPSRVATDFMGATLTYAEADRAMERAMGVLTDLGVAPGDRVALVLPNSPTHLVAYHAVLRLGAIVVELNPTYTAEELSHLLADSRATHALVWHKAVQRVLAAGAPDLRHVVSVDIARDLPRRSQLLLRLPVSAAREKREALRGHVPAGVPDWHTLMRTTRTVAAAAPGSGSDVALLQYTGGTTGTPKAARLTHRNLVANIAHGQAWAGFDPGAEVVDGILPFFHAFGLTFCLNLPGHIGATLVIFPNFDPAAVLAAQKRRPATFLPAVAPMLDRIADAADAAGEPTRASLRSVRLAFAGAMPIPAATVERWESLTGGLLVEGYGMTECAPIAAGNPCTPDRRPGTLGVPFPNTDIDVRDPEHPDTAVEPREDGSRRGELLVRGPQVFAGYWNQDDETARQLDPDGWLHTGDVVEVDPTGWITLVDRVKEMIIVGGFKVYPSQVEDHLRTMPGVADAAVVGLPTGEGDEEVLAALVLEPGTTAPTLAEVRAHAEARLPRYALPRRVEVLDELPRSQIGKVMRRPVRERFLDADPR